MKLLASDCGSVCVFLVTEEFMVRVSGCMSVCRCIWKLEVSVGRSSAFLSTLLLLSSSLSSSFWDRVSHWTPELVARLAGQSSPGSLLPHFLPLSLSTGALVTYLPYPIFMGVPGIQIQVLMLVQWALYQLSHCWVTRFLRRCGQMSSHSR